MKNRIWRGVTLAAVVFAGTRAAAGCSETPPVVEEPVASVITTGLSPNGLGRQVGQFVARVDHTTHKMVIEPMDGTAPLGGQITPQDKGTLGQSSWVLPDGGGTPVVNTVDLVTTSVDDEPDSGTFKAVVELRSFWARSFANVYVQVSAVTFNGSPISGYDGTNSVKNNTLGLDATHGLWSYSTNPADAGSFIGDNPSTKTTSGRWTDTETWKFANAADQNIQYTLLVWASTSFSNYTMVTTTAGYTDVCGSDGGKTTTNASRTVGLDFDVNIYDTSIPRSSTLTFNNNGQVLFGGAVTDGGLPPASLPSASAPGPAFFPFWDNLKYPADGGGMMCWNTFGSEPNQVTEIEWRNMDFAGGGDANKGASLTFEMLLHEGTGEIDTVYQTMIGPTGNVARGSGSQAGVGMQNAEFTKATYEFGATSFVSGAKYAYLPTP